MYDARAVANKVLEAADRHGMRLTNLKLQKLLFFIQVRSLVERNEPLLAGEFEAWQYGPVHPVAYSAFKHFGADEITAFARSFDPVLRTTSSIPVVSDPVVERYVDHVVSTLGRLSVGQLVDLTHADGGAWSRTIKDSEISANLGLKIRNEVIRQHFAKFRVVSSGGLSRDRYGDIRENTPYSRD